MRFEQLEQIIKIAENKSFTKAAKDLFISQPSFSVSVNNLEEELGLKIFERCNNGVKITEQGTETVLLAKNILELCHKIKGIMGRDEKLIRSLKLALPPAFSNTIMTQLIWQFRQTYPEVRLYIESLPPYEIIDRIVKRIYPLGVIITYSNEEKSILSMLKEKNIAIEKISGRRDHKLFVSSKNPLADRESVKLADLKDYRMVSYKNNHFILLGKQLSKSVKIIHDMELIKKLISEDYGIGILPIVLANNDLYVGSGLVKVLPIEDLSVHAYLNILYPDKEPLPFIEQELLNILRTLIIEDTKKYAD